MPVQRTGRAPSSDPIGQLIDYLMDHPSGLARDRDGLHGTLVHPTEILTSGVGEDDRLPC